MKAVVMAGGEGTRLRPLTSTRPKPMVPIFNHPVMQHILGLVKHHGITDVVVTLAFMPQVIQDYFGDGEEWGMDITYAVEVSPLGTAGSVRNAAAALDETFLVISGDALTDIDLKAVIDFHRHHDGPVTIALKRVPDPQEFGIVVTDEDGRIQRFLEKPTWAEVITDTVNTGIYVMDPSVFDYIPEGKPFDFSSDLFPKLMEDGHRLYGCIVDGYWCDVGSLEGYMAVHRDVLDGQGMIYIPGSRTRENVWVGEGAVIHPSAQIAGNVVIGHNTEILEGAVIGSYSVIGDNCFIGQRARVDHAIVCSDVFLAEGSSVQGAVICPGAEVRGGARVEQGATIGSGTIVGPGATICNNVQIYPHKRIEPGATVTSSVIWEPRWLRSLFGPNGIVGATNIDITPDLGMKVAQAFGSLLPHASHVVVSRDGSMAARMVKRAMASGFNATGCTVRDLRTASPGVTRFTTRDTRAVGGVHVRSSAADPMSLEIHFYDDQGMDLSTGMEKKIERLYFRGEFRRAYREEIGDVIYPARSLEYYVAGLAAALESYGPTRGPQRVVVDLAQSAASFVLPVFPRRTGLELITVGTYVDSNRVPEPGDLKDRFDRLAQAVSVFQADLGVAADPSAERVILVTGSGRVLDYDTALHALVWLWCRSEGRNGRGIAVPASASRVIEEVAAPFDRPVLRTRATQRALSAAALSPDIGFAGSRTGGYIFPVFLRAYDSLMSSGVLFRMLDQQSVSLDEVVAELPPAHLRHRSVPCPFDRKALVMRALGSLPSADESFRGEGVRLETTDGWALVAPDVVGPSVQVHAEGRDESSADSFLAWCVSVVESAMTDA